MTTREYYMKYNFVAPLIFFCSDELLKSVYCLLLIYLQFWINVKTKYVFFKKSTHFETFNMAAFTCWKSTMEKLKQYLEVTQS